MSVGLTVTNNSLVDGTGQATIVGVQNGVEVYRQVLTVADGIANGRTTFDFPAFVPASMGDITWTATLTDADPDSDAVTAITRVAP